MTNEGRIADYLAIASAITQRNDWQDALDSVMAIVRSVFMFDNLALYLADSEQTHLTDIVYARAVGRGQQAGPDAAWGADIAIQAMTHNETRMQEPPKATRKTAQPEDRLASAYLLGLPLQTSRKVIGALVFVRFGGPAFTPEQIQRAQFIATQFGNLLERKLLQEQIKALQEARQVIALQEDFIATISHELRTPLGFIKGYSTTLLRQDTEWDEATRREFLTIIDEEADHLTTLIENVLESARLQSNTLPMRFQPVRLDAIIRDAAMRAQARYKDMQINLSLLVTPVVLADGVRLAQVLNNLFSNAAKYAPGAPITITLTDEGTVYRIRFSDQGHGIPADNLPHLFQRFYRVPGQNSTGSGLGLFICRKIIETHRGDISVESEMGKGTTFIIDLPVLRETGTKGG
jgi:signal transduction histidine kinase